MAPVRRPIEVAGSGIVISYCSWFTEGFDTADLKDAKALLDGLSWKSRLIAHANSDGMTLSVYAYEGTSQMTIDTIAKLAPHRQKPGYVRPGWSSGWGRRVSLSRGSYPSGR
jgi:hypothetical protein